MLRVIVHDDAKVEAAEAMHFYESARAGYGAKFVDKVEEGLRRIGRTPLRWSLLRDPARRYPLPGFPYFLVYIPEAEIAFVLAVMQARRLPGYWIPRLADIEELRSGGKGELGSQLG